jgi:hypothetical protein
LLQRFLGGRRRAPYLACLGLIHALGLMSLRCNLAALSAPTGHFSPTPGACFAVKLAVRVVVERYPVVPSFPARGCFADTSALGFERVERSANISKAPEYPKRDNLKRLTLACGADRGVKRFCPSPFNVYPARRNTAFKVMLDLLFDRPTPERANVSVSH